MLEALNLSKAYDGKPVIRDFSKVFAPGGHYCLTGPSGSGKTTLLRLLTGLEKPDSGRVSGLNGLKISAVFQENRLLEHLTAPGNAAFVRPGCESRAKDLLAQMGVTDFDLPISAFSGGMKRRAALCRALATDYDALFLDEPYKGLDDATKRRVIDLVARETARKTVLLVTHDLTEADGYERIEIR